MPLALRTANVSCLPLKSWLVTTLCLSAQALLSIGTLGSFSGSTASGASRTISIVCASIRRAPLTPFSAKARCDGGFKARSIEKTASSALNGVPSWKVTPGRIVKRQAVGPVCFQAVARPGSRRNCSSRCTSDSYTWWTIRVL